MEKIHIGYIEGTHGLRGDLKVRCKNFERPLDALKVNNEIYLNDEKHTITNFKIYKNGYLIKIDNLIHINLVEQYKGYDVYTTREILDLSDDDYLMEDLIGMNIIYNSKNYGKVIDLAKNNNFILKIKYEDKTYMIPFVDAFILKVDVKNKNIICDDIRGLIL